MISILIPSRNEKYLEQTMRDLKAHAEGEIEILTEEDPGIGQRALTNKLARKAKGEFLMKCDAHCSFSQGFDVAMLKDMQPDMIMTPILCRLDAERWQIIPKPFTKKYYFDTGMVFQYCEDQTGQGLVETMALQGSCFLVSRENYWKWNICDEAFGSWGFMGSETACKAWFNGGRVVTNTDAYYGHFFRTTDIPYVRASEEIEHARASAKRLLQHPKMPWLVEKFHFPGDWTKEFCDSLESMV